MDGGDFVNPFSRIVSGERRVTRSIARALETQVVGSILNQIDTGIERPVDFVPTDYFSRCTNRIFGRPAEPSTEPSFNIERETGRDTVGNSLNFSRKIEKLSEMSSDQQANTNLSPSGGSPLHNEGQRTTNDTQLSQLMAMLLQQNQMLASCMNELKQVRGDLVSLNNRVAEVETSGNANFTNAPGTSSTPSRTMQDNQIPPVIVNDIDERNPFSSSHIMRNSLPGPNRAESVGRTTDRDRRVDSSGLIYQTGELERRKPVDLDKWHIKFDGSGRDMTVESFIFRIEKMREQYNITFNQLFSDFHCLVTGSAAKWYWQVLEDNADEVDFDYFRLKRELLSQFKSADTDYDVISQIVEYKQQPGQSFEEFYTEIHNLTFKLHKRVPERELVQIIRNNLRSNMATLIFSATIETIAELKRECKRAEKLLKENRQRPRVVNSLDREDENEIFDLEAVSHKMFGQGNRQHFSSDRMNNKQSFSNSPSLNSGKTPLSNPPNQQLTYPTVSKAFCQSPFHLNLCFTCGMPGDYYRKNSDNVKQAATCKSTFHDMKCFSCGKDDSFCEYGSGSGNAKMTEVTGNFCQTTKIPEPNQ